MGVVRYKIWNELWQNRGRTLQVVLIIAVGAFAIGMIISARNLMVDGMNQIWAQSSPMMIGLAVNPAVDDDTLIVLRHLPGVADVEGEMTTSVEWRLTPDQPWQSAYLTAREDYAKQHFAKLTLLSGQWPRGNDVAIGQGAEAVFGVREGESVTLRVNDREHVIHIKGTVYSPNVQPPSFGGPVQFYATRDRYEYLTGERNFNAIMAAAPVYDEAVVTDIANRMQDKLEKQGVDSFGNTPPEGKRTVDPSKHFFQSTMDGIFLVLGIMAGLALILGLFLVYNTINAIITQQVNQIGIMKAVGAKTGDILFIYLLNVFMYGFMALLIAVPLGAVGGYGLNSFLMGAFNAEGGGFSFSPPAVVAQVAIALLAPLLASLIPILSGVRVTVREAISTYGLSAKPNLLDRFLARIERIPRLVLLTVSNTFRHKGRVILTQITLVLSGLIFMMVMSVGDSVTHTFGDVLFSILRFNVTLAFKDPERIEEVEALTLTHPDVKAVEMWAIDSPKIRPATRAKSDDDLNAVLFGVPLPTQLYGPQMRAGRWLQPGDTNAVVLTQKLAKDVGVGVGDWVTFDHGVKGESTWQVVGLVLDPVLPQTALAPREAMLHALHSLHKAQAVWIQTVRGDPASETAAARSLRQFYEDHQLKMSPTSIFGTQGDTASGLIANVLGQFAVIITLLAVMAVLIGIVGSIALSGVLSLNVLERRREIGVMRAIGASSRAISGIFIGEGLILGLLSWVIALPLSIPAGRLMTAGLGAVLNGEIVYEYTPKGAFYWLGIIIVLSVVASWFPARGATRISVRESLAYA
jgi:putative ABC transport system permease protein